MDRRENPIVKAIHRAHMAHMAQKVAKAHPMGALVVGVAFLAIGGGACLVDWLRHRNTQDKK
jgi:hypothetical protein